MISTEGGVRTTLNDDQLTYLQSALARCKSENFSGAVLVAVHHPPFTGGVNHGGSPRMLQDMDDAATKAGFWPHVVLSGHSHNYQRYTRTVAGDDNSLHVVAGMGGHGADCDADHQQRQCYPHTDPRDDGQHPTTGRSTYDTHYGYMRVIVNATTGCGWSSTRPRTAARPRDAGRCLYP